MVLIKNFNRMKRNLIILISIIISLTSCHDRSKYPGYKHARHGIYYQLHKIGEDTDKPKPGDFVTVDLLYKTLNDSVFFIGKRKFQVTTQSGLL